MNVENILHNNNPILAATFAILIFMSLVSWYLVVWKSLSLRKERKTLQDFCKSHIKTPDWPLKSKISHSGGSVEILVKEAEKLKLIMEPHNHEEKKEILSMHLVQSLDLIKIKKFRYENPR